MTKLTVVVETSTKKIIPFEYKSNGEIMLTGARPEVTEDNTQVMVVESARIDWENMKLLDYPVYEHLEAHPFDLFYVLKDC